MAQTGSGPAASSTPAQRRGKRKVRFNLLDFLIILLILAIAAAAVFAYIPGLLRGAAKADSTVVYTLSLDGVDPLFSNSVSAGDRVMLERGENIGTVKAVEARDSYKYAVSADGSPERIATGMKELIITVSAPCSTGESSVTVSGVRIAAGLGYNTVFPNLAASAVCRAVAVEGGER